MNGRLTIVCALVLLITSAQLSGQKTEVHVKEGKVVAETQAATVNIDAGQKAVLKEGASPSVTVDSPLVRDALELYKLAEEEKDRGSQRIDSTLIVVIRLDEEETVGAAYFEVPNPMPEATNVLTISSSGVGDIRVYDLSGNLCKVEAESLSDFVFSYSIHFPEEVEPGELFKLIGVANIKDIPSFPGGAPALWKDGPLWYLRSAHGMSNTLNYLRLILPESAILVDTNREIVATDTFEGRPAVTMRNYTGPYYDGMFISSFLWPDKDGTTLGDIPDEHHGLRSPRDEQNSEMFREEMREIMAGKKYTDQSTPIAVLLTCLSSTIHEDIDLYKAALYMERSSEEIRNSLGQAKYWAGIIDILSMPELPENPGDGYVHPVYLCRRGSTVCEYTQPIVYYDGQWYNTNSRERPLKSSEYLTAEDIAAAKKEGYLCDWEVAGPYVQRGKGGGELRNIPLGPELPDVDVRWQPVSVEPHDEQPVYINLARALYNYDRSVAYLRTRIVSEKARSARLEIYSGDGADVWLNGKLIPEGDIYRRDDPDLATVTLKKGTNDLMLKVPEGVMVRWGAIVRVRPAASGATASDK